MLPYLISPFQSSFVLGRQIIDDVVVMQEVLHLMRSKSGVKGWMAIKQDLGKAYDCLWWEFIQDTLSKKKIPAHLIGVTMHCISSCSLNILWNGEPTGSFSSTRGIRQGDLLSPYLFVACMETLSQLIESKCKAGRWKGVPVSKGGLRISHLMFAYDVVLFGEVIRIKRGLYKRVYMSFVRHQGRS